MQHAQCQIGDRRSDLSARVLAIGDTYRGTFQVFQRVKNNFAMLTDQHRESIYDGFVGGQDFVIDLAERTLVQQIQFAGFASYKRIRH